jgi:hypothetical protein
MAPPFLTAALDVGKWSASSPGRFIHAERASGNNWIGGWVGSGTGLEALEKRKTFPLPGIEALMSSPLYTDHFLISDRYVSLRIVLSCG